MSAANNCSNVGAVTNQIGFYWGDGASDKKLGSAAAGTVGTIAINKHNNELPSDINV